MAARKRFTEEQIISEADRRQPGRDEVLDRCPSIDRAADAARHPAPGRPGGQPQADGADLPAAGAGHHAPEKPEAGRGHAACLARGQPSQRALVGGFYAGCPPEEEDQAEVDPDGLVFSGRRGHEGAQNRAGSDRAIQMSISAVARG